MCDLEEDRIFLDSLTNEWYLRFTTEEQDKYEDNSYLYKRIYFLLPLLWKKIGIREKNFMLNKEFYSEEILKKALPLLGFINEAQISCHNMSCKNCKFNRLVQNCVSLKEEFLE